MVLGEGAPAGSHLASVSAPSPPEQISSVAPSALPCVRGHLRSRFGRRPTNGGARRCGVRSRDDAVETAGHVCRPPYRYFSFAQGVRYARRAARARAFLARTRRLFAGSSGRCGNLPSGVGISRRDNVQRSPEPLHSVWDLRRFRRLRFFAEAEVSERPTALAQCCHASLDLLKVRQRPASVSCGSCRDRFRERYHSHVYHPTQCSTLRMIDQRG